MQWPELTRTLRISTIIGLIGGCFGAAFGIFIGAEFDPGLFLLFIFPVLSLFSSLALLRFSMSSESRGILGFVSIVGALAPILFIALLLLRLVFPHRDTPTGL